MANKRKGKETFLPPPIPAPIDKTILTISECQLILNRSLASDVKAYVIDYSVYKEPFLCGFRCEYFTLSLAYVTETNFTDENKFRKFLLKAMPTQRNENDKSFKDEVEIFQKEASLYSTVLPELMKISKRKWGLDCYYANEKVIVLENIEYSLYSHSKYARFLYVNQIRSLLKSIATMHASSVVYEIHNQYLICEKYKFTLREVTMSPLVDFWATGLQVVYRIALKHPSYQSPEHQSFIENELMEKIESAYEMLGPSGQYINVLCHCDLWGGNMFFSDKENENSPVLFDFYNCRYCPPAIDVLFAIYLNVRPFYRKDLMDIFQKWYYECFATALQILGFNVNNIMTLEEFQKSCNEYELCAALYTCVAATIYHVPDSSIQNMKKSKPNDFLSYVYSNREKCYRVYMRRDQFYSDHLFDSITDLMNALGVKA